MESQGLTGISARQARSLKDESWSRSSGRLCGHQMPSYMPGSGPTLHRFQGRFVRRRLRRPTALRSLLTQVCQDRAQPIRSFERNEISRDIRRCRDNPVLGVPRCNGTDLLSSAPDTSVVGTALSPLSWRLAIVTNGYQVAQASTNRSVRYRVAHSAPAHVRTRPRATSALGNLPKRETAKRVNRATACPKGLCRPRPRIGQFQSALPL